MKWYENNQSLKKVYVRYVLYNNTIIISIIIFIIMVLMPGCGYHTKMKGWQSAMQGFLVVTFCLLINGYCRLKLPFVAIW